MEAVSQITLAATSTVADPIHLASKEPTCTPPATTSSAWPPTRTIWRAWPPLTRAGRSRGSILVGELDGAPVVALSLDDDRAISDPFSPTGHLLATMRVRARGVRAVAHMPSLRDRLLAGLPTIYRARLTGRAV